MTDEPHSFAANVGRFLYLVPPPLPPERDIRLNKTTYMGEVLPGDALMPVWWRTEEEAIAKLGAFPIFQSGRFRLHLFLWAGLKGPSRVLKTIAFYVNTGRRIHREERIAAIMCYGTNWNGIAAVILKWITGAKLIAEIPGVPHHAFVMEVQHPTWKDHFKKWCADRMLSFVVSQSDRTKLLYPEQLDQYPKLKRKPASVFHDFIPASLLGGETTDEKFLLTLGFPWYRKGIDVLIRGFAAVHEQLPGYRLRIVGYIPEDEKPYLESLVAGCPAISLEKAVKYEEALSLMRRCSIFVLASRSEAMGRVLLEAMAAKKPVLASRATGIPRYVRDGENGLLFESGNAEDLSKKLLQLVNDQPLQHRMGERGYEFLRSDLDEAAYVAHFREMLAALGVVPAANAS